MPEIGVGWYPVQADPYGTDYWEKYRMLDRTPSGDALTGLRMSLIDAYWEGEVIDIGIGGGRFVSERSNTRGYDINPSAVDWLKTQGAYCDPYSEVVDAVCFWDSLEHIHDPAPLLANVRRMVFMSLPIFEGPEHVLRSKHFKPAEHCFYFTFIGLQKFMAGFGFELIHSDRREQSAGREDIGSYVFTRRNSATGIKMKENFP